jgi:hypothetical protein
MITFGICGMTLAIAGQNHAAIVVWDGSCGGPFWNQTCGPKNGTSNWNNDQLPTLGDQVSIPMGAPVVQCLVPCQAGTISCQSGLALNSSDGGLEVNSGTITSLVMNSNSATGLKINGGEVTLVGNTNWAGGRASGTGNLKNTGGVSGNPQIIGTVDFTNDAGASTTVRSLFIQAGASVVNASGGTFTFSPISSTAQLTSSGDGILTNHGTLVTANGTGTTIDVGVQFMQDTGSFTVTGNTSALGTRMLNNSTFTGGSLTISDNSKLRFQNVGGTGIVHSFNGIQQVTGTGNMYIETPGNSDWRLDNDAGVVINLTGTDGLVLGGTFMTLTGVLNNQGTAWWSGGRIRSNTDCGFCAPEFRNQGGLRIATSSVNLDTWLRNSSNGYVLHAAGVVIIGEDSAGEAGLITNEGTYEQRRGSIRRHLSTQQFGSFNNVGTYVRPDHPDTQNVQNEAPFVLNFGGDARFEKAETVFAGQSFSGLDFLGGDIDISVDALVRVGRGSVEGSESQVAGGGQFHIGGVGQGPTFTINEGGVLRCSLGPGGEDGGADGGEDGGTYLDVGGRIGGEGELVNLNNFYMAGGTIGFNGAGRVHNRGAVTLTSGQISNGGELFNAIGQVTQTGTLTLNNGFVENRAGWEILSPSIIQGSAVNEFFNHEQGIFFNAIPAGQTTTVSARFDNEGAVWANTGTLVFTGQIVQVSGGALTDGDWIVSQGATLDLPGVLTAIDPGASVQCDGTWNDLNTVVLNEGDLTIKGVSFNQPVSNEGTMELTPGSDPDVNTIQNGTGNLNNSTLGLMGEPSFVPAVAGSPPMVAVRCANLNNSGTVGPGGAGAAGPFRIDGNYNQSATGVLQIDLGGVTPMEEHDQLVVDGNVLLEGHLHVRVLPRFVPEGGEQFTIVTATNGAISGTFDAIDGHGQYSVSYSPTAVTLTLIAPPHPGDTNNDGQTNADDLVNVVLQWGACPAPPAFCPADLDGSGMVDADDLITVVLNWD